MKNKFISEIGERELINILLKKRDEMLNNPENTIKESYHDDAALIKNSHEYTVISTDMLFQHSHFPKKMTYYQMGSKAVTVNVSDILAMNATPESILISMGLTPDMTLEDFDYLTDGILDKCKEYDITLIGGDINEATEIVLCGTSIGKIDDDIKLQKGIESNNLIAVTGELGGPAAALDLLKEPILKQEHAEIIDTLLNPTIPLKESRILKKYPGLITGMTDITDGLAIELGHLHDKNACIGFEILFDNLPFNNMIKTVAQKNSKNLLDYLLHFGEEFELLLTLNPDEYYKHESELNFLKIIGQTNNSGEITLIKDDVKEIIPIKGYEHLKDD